MKRYVSVAGVLAVVVVVAFAAVASVGLTVGSADGERAADADTTDTSQETEQQGIPVKEAAPGIGLRADISDYPVTLDGKPDEGKKILHVLGGRLYLNQHSVLGPRRWHSYADDAGDELNYLYGHLVAERGLAHLQALRRLVAYVRKLPGVADTPSGELDDPKIDMLLVRYKTPNRPDLPPVPAGHRFAPRIAQRYANEGHNSPSHEQAVSHFKDIISGLEEDKTLRVRRNQKYSLK